MSALLRFARQGRRAWEVMSTFTWNAWSEAKAYPLGLLMVFIGSVAAPIVLYFVGQLVPSQASVGGDYFTFAAIGVIASTAMSGGLAAFGGQLDVLVQSGRFENLLVEPIRWRVLPFALAGWPVTLCLLTMAIQSVVVLVLGADIKVEAIPLSVILLLGGIASGHAVGVLAGSVKVLSKRSDPIIALYTLAVGLLSGAAFPVSLLPAPIRVFSYALPQTYVLSALRQVLMPGGSSIEGPSAGLAVVLLTAFLVVVYPLGLFLFGRALEYARKIGALAGY
jgi:ABC-2 type transport system permease protein